jgi:heme-degrading monooxygenase HmoA
MTGLSRTPEPPYYAVIFTSLRTDGDHGYAEASQRMLDLAATQPGYLGVDSARDPAGPGITVSYWRDEASIAAWKANADHTAVRDTGRAQWYERFTVRVARVERAYDFRAGR